jgi:hypothetical protein
VQYPSKDVPNCKKQQLWLSAPQSAFLIVAVQFEKTFRACFQDCRVQSRGAESAEKTVEN